MYYKNQGDYVGILNQSVTKRHTKRESRGERGRKVEEHDGVWKGREPEPGHLDPTKDVWIGVAPTASANLQYPPAVEGSLSWLDNSTITYSKWMNSTQPGAGCGHILRESDFHWNATKDCNKKLHSVCQFESGRSIVCAGHHTTLQCGSGQVLMLDGAFYGRKNMHYCQPTLFPRMTPTQHQCGWVDVLDTLTAHCQGHQVCQTTEFVDFFGEPCPQFGSYLSLEYHCKDVLTLSTSNVAAVYDDVTIRVKWLIDLPQGHLSCTLRTGDGHVIYLHITQGLESSAMHKYAHPNTFVAALECIKNDIHITAQEVISIQETITELGPIRCYSGKLPFHSTNCKALDGEPFQVQMEVKAGTNVTYRIQRGEMLLSAFSVVRGNIPQNITVAAEKVKQLGPGCHHLTLYASNMVTSPETSADLQMCVLENVAGLQASVLADHSDCQDSSHIPVGVSLQSGAPVLLLFFLTGEDGSFSEMREMKKRKDIFYIGKQIKGPVKVKLRAWNIFSSMDVDVDMFTSCGENSLVEQNSYNDYLFQLHGRQRKKHIRVDRSAEKFIGSSEQLIRTSENLIATTVGSIPNTDLKITLSVDYVFDPVEDRRKQWSCKNPCECQGVFSGVVHVIKGTCVPGPFEFNKYHFEVIQNTDNKVKQSEAICITYTPKNEAPSWLSLSCTEGCDPVGENKNAKIKMSCKEDKQCPTVEWSIEDPRKEKDWHSETKKCYKYAKQRPLTRKMNGGTEYTVDYSSIKEAKKEGVTVVILYKDGDYYYKKFHIATSSSEQGDNSADQTTKPSGGSTASPGTIAPAKTNSPANPPTPAAGKTTKTAVTTKASITKTTAPPALAATTPNTAIIAKTDSADSENNPTAAEAATTTKASNTAVTTVTIPSVSSDKATTTMTSNTPAITTKSSNTPAITTKSSNTPAITTKSSNTPAITTKSSNTPAITTKSSNTPAITTKSSNTPAITTKSSNTPAITTKSSNTPAITTKSSNTPAITTKSSNTPAITTKSSNTPAITTKSSNTPAITTKSSNTPAITTKSSNTPAITTKSSNTPAITTKSSNTPAITTKSSNTPAITTKSSNTPAITTKSSNTPAITTKSSNTPAITTKSSNTPAITTKNSNTPAITTKSSNTPAITTKSSNTPAITTKSSNTPAITTKSSNTPAITTKSSNTPAITTTSSGTTSPVTNSLDKLKCSISPRSGTILDAFTISCNTDTPCTKCQYCFKTQEGKHLRCTEDNKVNSIFLPLGDRNSNHKLIIKATAKDSSFIAHTTIITKVLNYEPPSGSSGNGLSASMENVVDQLKEQGQLTGETVGQICDSVSSQLNSRSDDSNKAERQKLREKILSIMTDTMKEAPSNNPEEVQVMARGLTSVSQRGSELSSAAQEEASFLLAELSSSLLNMDLDKSEENKKEVHDAACSIVEGAGNILHFSSTKSTSDALLNALDNTQSALLAVKDADEGPTIIQEPHISVLVNRVTPGSLNEQSMKIPNCSCSSFSLPTLPSDMLPSDKPVDIRMLSLDKNPFSWHEFGNISGSTGSLSLTRTDGSKIPVENLSDDVEIFLPRPLGEQVNTSVLYLGNFSTTVIDIPSANNTLVLKMIPSTDPLTFKVFLGYKDYPNETHHVAMTEMPQQGTTLEERYTWLLDPETLKGNTGLHYLFVRPIVGPGIKSIDTSLLITPITSSCKFWDESTLDWTTNGCRVGAQSTPLVTQCLCNHLTFFGSSFFVTPNLVDPSRTAELFATFAENPVVVCFVGALFVGYLLAVIWAWRKDIQDTVKVKVTVLEDNDPMDEYRYLLSVNTGHRRGASTSSQVAITLMGLEGNSEPHHLSDPKKRVFERGAVDVFLLTTPFSLGDLQGIRLWHNNSGSHPAWYVGNVMVQDLQTQKKWHFLCNSWLAIDMGDCSLDKVFPASTEIELKRFSNLFFTKTTKDFSDGHLWYSVISRPPSSSFTCVQRVSCCFSLLLCTMLTSIMFYGIPTDPSEQTLDLGHFEFTWQQFMIGVQSSLIMFPVNILIVSIFRNTQPRETLCCKRKGVKPDALEQLSVSQTVPDNVNVSLDTVIKSKLAKDLTRIALSLSKTVKSNIPSKEPEFGPGQHVDINAVLSVVEDFIKQNNKTCDSTHSNTQNFHNAIQPQSTEATSTVHSGSTEEGIQKKSNKSQYLYRQLCHIERELTLLGPSGFPSPHSYSQAVQQVQGMKGSLEDQLFRFSSVNLYEPDQKKLIPADSTDADDKQKKKSSCCHGGLPWWFIFIGWLLVIATSVVSGYFTMLYGLKFGKERSVSWLVSMIISFFQSVLIIQPLKVICLAIFFALVIKKVDEEDFQNLALDGNDKSQDYQDLETVRREGGLYVPPPAADIEKMKRNKIMEQKAFALIREILIYMGYMWMLLLVAYGQKDPNAFFLNRHIRHSFSRGITNSMSLGKVFTWANTSLLGNLFGVYPGFITDGNSKLVGNARLRQLRVQRNSCQIADAMLGIVPNCNAPYSWEAEDMGSYDPGWNHSVGDNSSISISSPWKYQTQSQLRAYPFWGKLELYRGGGFVVELGPDLQNASSTLEYLFRNKWLDMYTRAIFVEFSVYNANVNLFCIVTLLLETTAIGAFQFYSELQSVRLYQSTGALHIFVMAAEIIYMLFILHYMYIQGKLMKQQRWVYFRSKWNFFELTIIILSWSALAIYIKRTLLGNRDMKYYQDHKDQFASFYETAASDSVLQYLIAFLVLLSTIKLWHLLRLNPKMNLISATLERAWGDISGFLLILGIMFLAYSIASNLIYGSKLSHYRTLTDALLTIIRLQIGIFNYDEVLNSSPWLGGFIFGSCIIFMSYVVVNLLISVILVAFNEEQIYHKPSDEEEIVDLMLKKICSLFGIRSEDTADTTGPDGNTDMDLTLNNSRNIQNNPSVDVNCIQTSDHSVNRL
ncbi:polycystic kidney disease protein 1-like 2 [Notolabrus celidotus]|uniref:polycystic kidney disease protein 1-like 2 n=1 Tax=Notolabrus celidotus TaxID=1203425 RepID=UPI00148FF7F1|nr:polycystic kidney disease protein 1-like 2 [Notolabrus celidotus]